MDTATRVQILDDTDLISYSTNTLGISMNPITLPPAVDKELDRQSYLSLVRQPVYEKENSEIKPVNFTLKN